MTDHEIGSSWVGAAALVIVTFSSIASADSGECLLKCQNISNRQYERCGSVMRQQYGSAAAAGIGSSIGSTGALRGNRNPRSINRISAYNADENMRSSQGMAAASDAYEQCKQDADTQQEQCESRCSG